jgi:5-methylcytosine-specific restriction endonuclease McrA
MFNGLPSISDQQLLDNTDTIVVQDRKLTLRMLDHLHAVDRRKLYLGLGYGSMFKYCTKHQRMSEPDAVRKIRTARCVARFRQLIPLLESGDVSLTTVTMASKYIKPENCEAVITGIKNKSTREVQRFLAGYEPMAAVPVDRVRMIVVPASRAAAVLGMPAGSRQATISADGKKSSSVEELTLSANENRSQPVPPQFEMRARVEFTAHEELMVKLERVRSLMSHRLPINAPLEELFQFMADYVIEREDPLKRHERRAERAVNQDNGAPRSVPANPRQIPAAVRDQVFARDQRCTYVGPDGKRCNSTHVLQVDHIQPVARRGAAVIENLRLLCAEHNRLESERLMGKRHVIRESRASYAAA